MFIITTMKLVCFVFGALAVGVVCASTGSAWKDIHAFGRRLDKTLLWIGIGIGGTILSLQGFILILWLFSQTGASLGIWWLLCALAGISICLAHWLDQIKIAHDKPPVVRLIKNGWTEPELLVEMSRMANTIGWTFGDLWGYLKEEDSLTIDEDGDMEDKPVTWIIKTLLTIFSFLGFGFLLTFGLVRVFARDHWSHTEQHLNKLRNI